MLTQHKNLDNLHISREASERPSLSSSRIEPTSRVFRMLLLSQVSALSLRSLCVVVSAP